MTDTVRTLADYYPKEALKQGRLTGTIEKMENNILTIKYTGSVKLEQNDIKIFARTADLTSPVPKKPSRHYHAPIFGRASYDLQKKRFTSFELLACGEKGGGSRFSAFDKVTMGIMFVLSAPQSTTIEPRFLSEYGWSKVNH